MSRKEETRKYKMSDADLIQLTDSVADSADRDSTQLTAYGVDASTLTAIGAARDAFANEPTDYLLSGLMGIATNTKNAKREELTLMIRQVSDRARIKYGENSQEFKAFGVFMLTKQTDNELYRMGKSSATAATQFLASLASEGVTEAMITDLDTLTTEFDQLIDDKNRAVRNRDIAVDNRIRLGNEVYALLVNLAAKGKLCWADINEAYYNDYILNPSTGGGTADVATGNVAGNSTVNISITGNDASTSFTLKNTGDEMLNFYFATEPTDDFGPMSITVAPHSEQVSSANDLGFSEAENRLRLNVHNASPANGSYEVMWE